MQVCGIKLRHDYRRTGPNGWVKYEIRPVDKGPRVEHTAEGQWCEKRETICGAFVLYAMGKHRKIYWAIHTRHFRAVGANSVHTIMSPILDTNVP